jgi:hypothetical protein
MYHTLRVLMEEVDQEKFHTLLEGALIRMESTNSRFYDYFKQTYASRYAIWAYSYRKAAGINTNMYAQSFHHVLKYIYMKGHVNKRLDCIIHLLMKYARDKAFDRIAKIEKGKSTKRTKAIHDRHLKSLELPISSVTDDGKDSWQVQSQTSKVMYSVTRDYEKCPHNCLIECKECCICVHIFSCNCADSLQLGTICKHIHLVVRYIGKDWERSESQLEITPSLLTSVTNPPNSKERILQKLNRIATYLHSTSNIEAIMSIEKRYINPAIHCIELYQEQKSATPPNKLIEKQNFFSTKRKRQSSKIRLGKPSHAEKGEIKDALLHTSNKDTGIL